MTALALDQLALVTGNRNKVVEAKRITGHDIELIDIDLPEIQGLDMETVLRAKGAEAWHQAGRPVIVEETGLELQSMNGFPGPLVKWMLDAVGPAGITRAAEALGGCKAVARCQLLVVTEEGTIFAEGHTDGHLVQPPRGDHGFGWDPVFEPDGYDQTYAELGQEIKDEIGHRGRAWRSLLAQLT